MALASKDNKLCFCSLSFPVLQFKVTMPELKTQSLSVSVWHDSSFGRNQFLGDVNLNLLEWDFSNTQMNEYALKTRVKA